MLLFTGMFWVFTAVMFIVCSPGFELQILSRIRFVKTLSSCCCLLTLVRRQIQGPSLQHRALLDTLALSEKGAHLELQEPDTQVGTAAHH